MLRVIQELDERIMDNWYVASPVPCWLVFTLAISHRFESSYGARFYTSKFHISKDTSSWQGEHYVLFRSLDGAAIRSSWYVLPARRT